MPMPRLTSHIDETLLAEHWTCPHWEYFRRHSDTAPARRHKYAPQLLLNDLLPEFEQKHVPAPFVEAKGLTFRGRVASTLRLMKKGTPVIWRPALAHGEFRGMPDYLERREGKSDLGDFHYVAVDVKNIERINPSHRSQAGLYAMLLEKAQGREPAEGFVSTVPFPSVQPMPVAEARTLFNEAVDEINAARRGEEPAPYVSSGCKQSPWFADCMELAKRRDDIALLYNVREGAMRKMRKLGIRTLADVRAMEPRPTARETGIPVEVLERHKLQSECLAAGRHLLREQAEFPPADVEVFFDIEGDPMRPVEYLLGAVLRTKREDGTLDEGAYHHVLAEKPEQEGAMWKEFLAWLETLPEGVLAVYHFGSYEISRLSLLAQTYGGSPAVDRFRAAMIDLAEVVKGCVVLPLYFYSLKDIGRYIGVDRGNAISAGGVSVSWYESWLASKSRKKLDTIVEYNRDDVVATAALKDWLARGAAL
jgi:predicted RecB family nuclease